MATIGRIMADRPTLLLGLLLATATVLSINALNPIDLFVNTFPRLHSDLLRTLLINWPDNVAGRAVALPVLGVVSLFLALRSRSWRPVIIAAGSVFTMICLVAGMKLVLARSHPRTGDPSFFVDIGHNFSFPSGHGANAILIYGVALYLIVRYQAVRPSIALRLGYIIAMIACVQAGVSAYLHFHWATDLVAGMIAGGLVLRVTVLVDRMIPDDWTVGWWPFLPAERCVCGRPLRMAQHPVVTTPAPGRYRQLPVHHERTAPTRRRRATNRPMPTRPTRIRATRPPSPPR
ncbi:phosphatase PAP2 family protein [Spiractinospora alimapuensis]|uniref:phosphatase PAP2 family protein n=1 Tax=Spiractinospora alimapuensis TaxID=2820884 RepID=UPI001F3575BA|nr:phosphatase PAP2 family protein [Spiractinospora alimapuensis]